MNKADRMREVALCMFLLSTTGIGVDLEEVDELLRGRNGIDEAEADEWFAEAAREGVVELGEDRFVQ